MTTPPVATNERPVLQLTLELDEADILCILIALGKISVEKGAPEDRAVKMISLATCLNAVDDDAYDRTAAKLEQLYHWVAERLL